MQHVIWSFAITLLLLTICSPVQSGTEAEIIAALDEAEQEGTWGYVPLSGPYIDTTLSPNVTAQKGKTAVLSCRILYIVGKTVSWIRARDLHLLTVGRFTYTSDDRFKALHQSGSDDWLLKIHYVQHRDSGAYECQVSTTPPMSHTVYLTVLDPLTTISGGPDLYINSGSTINLLCEVRFIPEPPPYIFWYHNKKLLSYDRERSGMTVVTKHNVTGISLSRLTIENASLEHSGRYNCSPATAPQHSINVHVINRKDEEPAAIHHKNTTSSSSISTSSSSASNPVSSTSKDGHKKPDKKMSPYEDDKNQPLNDVSPSNGVFSLKVLLMQPSYIIQIVFYFLFTSSFSTCKTLLPFSDVR